MTLLSCVFMSLPSKAPGISTLSPALRQEPQFPASLFLFSLILLQTVAVSCSAVEWKVNVCPWILYLPLLSSVVMLRPHSAPSKVWEFTSEATCAQSVPDTGCTMAGEVPRVQSLGLLSLPFFLYVYCCLLFKTVPCYVTQLTSDPFSPQLPKITGIHPA